MIKKTEKTYEINVVNDIFPSKNRSQEP